MRCRAGVEVPSAYIKDGKIVLNLSRSARPSACSCKTTGIEFDARFAGVVHHVRVPMNAVLGVYARETGEGMVFNEGEPEAPPPPATPLRPLPALRAARCAARNSPS